VSRSPIVQCREFSWQLGYNVFAVGRKEEMKWRNTSSGKRHRLITLLDELREIPHLFAVEYDERYV
jgi:hypothetical protein